MNKLTSNSKDLFLTIPKIKKMNFGYCPICEKKTIFYTKNDWLRDNYFCLSCRSIPRFRAIIKYVKQYFPNYKNISIHESSPMGASSEFIANNCKNYSSSHYFSDISIGQIKDGHRCENLELLTFENGSFDLLVTQDVFEHILHPELALKEIERVLRPGGAHMFTVPYYSNIESSPRIIEKNGAIVHIKEPIYHKNPISNEGSLVTYDWGYDIADYIYSICNMTTTILYTYDQQQGIEGEFIEVFISRKSK